MRYECKCAKFFAGATADDEATHGIYYADVGKEVSLLGNGSISESPFDLYIINTTAYIPHKSRRNGKRAVGRGDFGQINLGENRRTTFKSVPYST